MHNQLFAKLFNVTSTMPVNEASGMLATRMNTLFEVRLLKSSWARDAAWTDDVEISLRNTFGVMPRTAAANNSLIAVHLDGFKTQAAAGVEGWRKWGKDETVFPEGLLVPGLYIDRNTLDTGVVSLRFDWAVHYYVHRVSKMDYLENLKLWGIDDDGADVQVKYINNQF